jgi:hypothetical protein
MWLRLCRGIRMAQPCVTCQGAALATSNRAARESTLCGTVCASIDVLQSQIRHLASCILLDHCNDVDLDPDPDTDTDTESSDI